MNPTYGSVCSGAEAVSVAWEELGFRPAWFSEIEPEPCALLAHRFPHVPNLGDMTRIAGFVRAGIVPPPDILVGGTPCQAFSVAGVRAGLADPRGQLTLSLVDLANAIDEKRPGDECVVYWENVVGVLTDRGNAFGCFLGHLAGEDCELVPPGPSWPNAGYVYGPQRAIAWRVLDAQFFGLAQQRQRVLLVASARKGFDPAKLLFELDGRRRDFAPERQAQAHGTGAGPIHAGGTGHDGIIYAPDISPCLQTTCNDYSRSDGFVILAVHTPQGPRLRRLTIRECERLQGFPDDWTLVPFRGRPMPEGARYAMMGNTMPVPMMRWLGERLTLTHPGLFDRPRS